MTWPEISSWLFIAAWSAIGLYVARSIQRISISIEKLNVNVAVVIEQVSGHAEDIKELKRRVERVERIK